MPKPRERQISLLDTPYYHVCSRVVRKAFLCGIDESTGKSYEHRRDWVEARIHQLSQVYSIDICAYAVMHNHVHIVLYVDTDRAKNWSTAEVLNRWHQLFKGTLLTQQYISNQPLDKFQQASVDSTAETYRKRLMDISWFMRSLNESIARQANAEDNCTGRFWEGRFKSQALLDEAALLACMAYVDLNPVRSKVAKTPEQSAFTGIRLRVRAALKGEQPKQLVPFIGGEQANKLKGLNFTLQDYLTLVDSTGRVVREGKAGAVDQDAEAILTRLQIPTKSWLKLAIEFEQTFTGAVGTPSHLAEFTEHVGLKRSHGIANSKQWLNMV
ncbi:transposase [Thalassomonas sp. RHCl1]|uniref:transposase n=1 Tax=Thalassomonas sp. RHCl1 TaxID=2995320 RepID=UPI00248BB4A8|nr:transposase [Thalassomonas sp. RHCl1]